MPKVSVIIPVYNVEPYLARCLDSVINQTLKDIEIICINDCSPDNSLAILEEYAQKDNRIKIIDFKENKNAAVARNAGLEIAKGEYLGFVDPDDYIDLNFYEELYNKAIEDNADIAKCECKTYHLNGKIEISKLNNVIEGKNKYYFTHEWWTSIYKASMVFDNNIKFPEECPKAQDIVFLNKCILKANKLAIVDNIFYNYVKREDSLDAQDLSIEKIESGLKAFELIFENLNKLNLLTIGTNSYNFIYGHFFNSVISIIFRNREVNKSKYAKTILSMFTSCKTKHLLGKEIKFLGLCPVLLENNIEKLTEILEKNNSIEKLRLNMLREGIKRK